MSQASFSFTVATAALPWMDGVPTESGVYWRRHRQAVAAQDAVCIVKLELVDGGQWQMWRLGYGEDCWDVPAGHLEEYRWARVPSPPIEMVW